MVPDVLLAYSRLTMLAVVDPDMFEGSLDHLVNRGASGLVCDSLGVLLPGELPLGNQAFVLGPDFGAAVAAKVNSRPLRLTTAWPEGLWKPYLGTRRVSRGIACGSFAKPKQ